MFLDADFCGDEDHRFASGGGWLQLTGANN